VTIDWTAKESVRAKLRVMVKRILRKHGYPPDKQEKATKTVWNRRNFCARNGTGKHESGLIHARRRLNMAVMIPVGKVN